MDLARDHLAVMNANEHREITSRDRQSRSLLIGAGGTYGAGGTCADAIPTDKETVASERQPTRAKNIAVILTCITALHCAG